MKNYDFGTFLSIRRERGAELVAHCPFHDDRNPSFSANVETGLWKCHAGCGGGTYSSFLKAIRTGVLDQPTQKQGSTEDKSHVEWSLFRKTAEYIYLDLGGRPALRIARLEKETGEKTFLQAHLNDNGEWIKGGTHKLLLPYRYQHWSDSSDRRIIIVEGEKCADFLFGLGFEATTFAGGSNGWKTHYADYFKSKEVLILPDNDVPGKRFADEVCAGLGGACRKVMLPDLNLGEDVVDWIKRFKNLSKFRDFIK